MNYLWQDLKKISALLKGNRPKLLLLDFDGTLTPIAQSPQEAKLSEKTKKLLQKLSKKSGFYLAILSGRKLDDIKTKINLQNIIYGGNHGLEGEILGEKFIFPIPSKMLRDIREIKKELNQIAGQFKGVLIEDKELTLSFHYRLANKQQVPEIRLLINRTLKPYLINKSVSKIAGKKVIDIMPNLKWNKGHFAALIIKKITLLTNKRPLVIAIGNDLTDEDIFQKLKNEITATVGKKKKSWAKYYLKNSKDTVSFLEWLNNLV